MMKRFALLAMALVLLAAACGDSGEDTVVVTDPPGSETTVPDETTGTDEPDETTVPDTGDTVDETSPTTQATTPPSGDMTPCQELWPEEFVLSLAGDQYTFFDANIDDSACTFIAGPDSITVFFRTGTPAEFDQAQSGAALTGEVQVLDICDASYSVEVQGTIVIVEGLSGDKVYNATMTAIPNALGIATALVERAC